MIDRVSGQVVEVGDQGVVLMVGGVGLRLSAPPSVRDVASPGHSLTLYAHLVVREDALTLYGFAEPEERALFVTLLTVPGVGPRLALSVISTLTVEHLQNAVAREEPDVLTRVPGIGKKLAQKLVFELKDKIAVDHVTGLAAISELDTDVLATLTALGYSLAEAQAALQSIPRGAPDDIEERVRLALEFFS